MDSALLVVGGLFILVYGPLAALAWRRPLLARMAFRESVRRPGQLALLVAGLLIGSATITASLVGADSSRDARVLQAYRQWGQTDLLVHSNGRFFSTQVADRLAADPELAPFVDGVQTGVELSGSVADLEQRLTEGDVMLVGFDPSAQRAFGAYSLIGARPTHGEDLAAGDVLLSQKLGVFLGAQVGDRLRIKAGLPGDDAGLRVAGIAAWTGAGAYGSPLAVYMPLSTARLLTGDDRINVVRISARGDQPAGLEAADRAAGPLASAVRGIPFFETPLLVSQSKHDTVRLWERGTENVAAELLAFTALIVAAGAALVVNLMLALAEERRPRLAILRALGLGRPGLIVLSVLEGAVYSLAAAAAGVFVGVFAGRLLAAQLSESFSTFDPGFQPVFSVKPATLAVAFVAGALITLTTVAVAAYRTSRMSIAAAIRDLPEPASLERRIWLRRLVTGLLVVIGGGALLVPDPLARLGGGVGLLVAGTLLARERLPDRTRATLTGVVLTAWATIVVGGDNSFDDVTRYLTSTMLGVAVAVFGLCIVVAANLRLLEAGLGLLGGRFGRLQAALWPPVAQLSRRPLQSGLATGTFALAMVIITTLAIAVAAYGPDYARDSAGYDIRVTAAGRDRVQLPAEIQGQITQRVDIPMRMYVGPIHAPAWIPNGDSVAMRFYEFSDQLLKEPPINLVGRDKRFGSNEEVWQAMAGGADLVILTDTPPGGEVMLQGLRGSLRLRVAGSQPVGILNGAVLSSATLAKIDTVAAGTTIFLKIRKGMDVTALAREIRRSTFSQGVQVATMHELLDRGFTQTLSYIVFFDVILRMGLLVGVLSLAVVGIRAAVERRRSIGIMRSLGYQPPRLLAGLVAEATLTATVGVLTGIGAGAFLGYVLMRVWASGGTFGIDGLRMTVALVIVYGTALTVTAALAWRAAQVPPADAIRHTG